MLDRYVKQLTRTAHHATVPLIDDDSDLAKNQLKMIDEMIAGFREIETGCLVLLHQFINDGLQGLPTMELMTMKANCAWSAGATAAHATTTIGDTSCPR